MNLYDKKYQVFISSTYKDLIDAREETIKVALNLFQIPIGMEMFSADNDEQWETIQKTIDTSDYYLLIIGHRYGSVTREGISYTEKEFEYAKEKGIPILAFIRNRNVPTKLEERDDDYLLKIKLDEFIQKVQSVRMVDFWSDTQELGKKVTLALIKQFQKGDRIGWIGANQAASPETINELTFLSKENRELKEEIERIKVKELAEPVIKILMNESEDILHLKFDAHLTKNAEFLGEITKDDYHLGAQNFFNGQLMGNYNKAISANKDVVDAYNFELNKAIRINSTPIPFEVNILNQGTIKAQEIHVTISFPEQICVIDKDNYKKVDSPKMPAVIPQNPIHIAQKAFVDSLKKNPLSNINIYDRQFGEIEGPYVNIRRALAIANFNVNHSTEVKLNEIKIWQKQLLHTRKVTFDEFYIVPLEKGFFNAKVSMICEEFRTKVEFEFPIQID